MSTLLIGTAVWLLVQASLQILSAGTSLSGDKLTEAFFGFIIGMLNIIFSVLLLTS